jgi:hypothetical protein
LVALIPPRPRRALELVVPLAGRTRGLAVLCRVLGALQVEPEPRSRKWCDGELLLGAARPVLPLRELPVDAVRLARMEIKEHLVLLLREPRVDPLDARQVDGVAKTAGP